jgi:Heparinase II/III-like protein/Heparinase II/III N-terminus
MTPAVLRKIAAMPRDEIRFRLTCEARKWGGRVREAVRPSSWDRAQLASRMRPDVESAAWTHARSAVARGDDAVAHRALLRHLRARHSAFPLGAREVDALSTVIRSTFPLATDHARARADAVLRGEYDLLGYRGLDAGSPPDWHTDPVHGRRAPAKYWSTVAYLDPAYGDHKVIWELNRHQHWLALARAYALTSDRRYYREFVTQLESWLAANPPLRGINWASMLEIAFRSLSWLWALEIFSTAAEGDVTGEPAWTVDLLLAIDRQLVQVEHNLSHYFSPNTHLSGEALALYVAGHALPELAAGRRRLAAGREVLVREAGRQIRPDGGHAELSGHYHRYSTDFYLLALAVARRAGDPAAAVFDDAARRQAQFLRTLADDRGIRPQIGDDDGGQLFPMCGRDPADCRDTLAIASIMLEWPELAVGPVPEEAFWMCGAAAATRGSAEQPARWPSAVFDASGYYVSRTPAGDHLIFDAGPHGYLNGGHAHADALAIVLTVAGEPLLIDPGTATYTMDPALRDRFRSTAMHNTLMLDDRPQSHGAGPFHWRSTANAHAPVRAMTDGCDYVEGTHDGYAPRRHTRRVLAIHGLGWWILDHVLGSGDADLAIHWHLHPAVAVASIGNSVALMTHGGRTLPFVTSAPLTLLPSGHELALWSPAYGRTESAPVLRSAARTVLPSTVATFIAAADAPFDTLSIEPVPIVHAPGDHWQAAAFRLHWVGGTMLLAAVIEHSGIAADASSAPSSPWGTADLTTDARLAALVETGTSAEAILINGSSLHLHGSATPIALPHRVPILRRAVAQRLASTVHVPAGVQ